MIARVTLSSGRVVLDTGKLNGKRPLYIGILAQQQRPPVQGSHAELMQRLFTTPEPPREWHQCPPVIDTRPSLRKRIANLLRGFK